MASKLKLVQPKGLATSQFKSPYSTVFDGLNNPTPIENREGYTSGMYTKDYDTTPAIRPNVTTTTPFGGFQQNSDTNPSQIGNVGTGFSNTDTGAVINKSPDFVDKTINPEGGLAVNYGPSQIPYSYAMGQDALDAGMNVSGSIPPDTGASYFGKDGIVGGVAQGAQALSGLANAYLGYKNYQQNKEKFGFEKAAANRNMANQASEYNTGLQNRGEVGIGLAGNSMSPDQVAARNAQLNSQRISTTPIG